MPDIEEKQTNTILKKYFNIKPLTDKEKQDLEKHKESTERIENIFVEYENDFSKKIALLLKEVSEHLKTPLNSDVIYAVKNIDNPQLIVNKIEEDLKKEFKTPRVKKNSIEEREHLHDFQTTLSIKIKELCKIIMAKSDLIDFIAQHHKPEIQSQTHKENADIPKWQVAVGNAMKSLAEEYGARNNKTYSSPEGNRLRTLAAELNKKADDIYKNRPIPKETDDNTANRTNYFDIERIEKLLPKLSDNDARRIYLRKIKDDYLKRSDKNFFHGFIKDGFKVPRPGFARWIDNQVSIYEKPIEINNRPKIEIEKDENKPPTWDFERSKIIKAFRRITENPDIKTTVDDLALELKYGRTKLYRRAKLCGWEGKGLLRQIEQAASEELSEN